jgi:MFS family permease
MDGNIETYITIFSVQSMLCITTTTTVYARLAVQIVEKARGLALAIVVSGSALFGMLIGPLLNAYVEINGWRAAFEAMAIFTAIAGAITFLLIPANTRPMPKDAPKRKAREDYPQIFRSAAFWFLAGAMLLCNLPQTLLQVQLKMLLIDNGISGKRRAPCSSLPTLMRLSCLPQRYFSSDLPMAQRVISWPSLWRKNSGCRYSLP